jgi:Phosphotransferase enzyme family
VPAGLLVIEDLAPRIALDRLIRRDGAAACLGLLAAFARARGELSAATAGRAGIYDARCAAAGYAAPAGGAAESRLAGLWDQSQQDAAALGTPVAGPAASELAAVLEELNAPGPFLALSHGDAESNNIMARERGPADARLIDFEGAGYAHALIDAVCLHVPGPGWICVGDPGGTGLADQYRSVLARGVPEAQDDQRYGFALASACMQRALVRLHRFAVLDTRVPGDHSRLQLVETLESAARTAEAHRALPHLAAGPGARPLCCAAAGPTRTWISPTGRGSRLTHRARMNDPRLAASRRNSPGRRGGYGMIRICARPGS